MEMQQPLISVIVPIYNVEKYVSKCLDSLRNQTLREIEVICIDDGSTDGSGRIADEYESSAFPVFRVIHTGNRGLSAARNRGIDESRSQWLMFVDSDDWVDERFCEIPYETAIRENADLVIFDRYWIQRDGKMLKTMEKDTPIGIVDEMAAHEYGKISAWNKLYRASLFESIRYPEGHVYEDVLTTHKLVHQAKTIVILQDCLYYHNYRKGSISLTHSEAQSRDSFMFDFERYNDLKKWGYPEDKLKSKVCSAALGFLAYTPYSNDRLHKKAEEIVDSMDGFPRTFPLLKRIALKVWKMDKRLFFAGSRLIAVFRR